MSNAVDLTRKIYDEAMGWYKSAENKAQILLGVLGTFTGIMTAIILGKPNETKEILDNIHWPALIALGLALLAIVYGVFACHNCLRSRHQSEDRDKGLDGKGIYPPFRLMFFGFHTSHEPERLYNSLINVRDESDEIRVYSSQIIKLSKNVAEKHKWVNRGFISISISIILLLLTTVLHIMDLN